MAVSPDTPLEDVETPEDIKVLFEPLQLGRYDLSTRVVYAPLTRCRAINTVPVDFTAKYYSGAVTSPNECCRCSYRERKSLYGRAYKHVQRSNTRVDWQAVLRNWA